ncbi:MAG: single-stranded-DNA-specific exonuclease RecJ [Bacteroidetes bacterium]|nr:single-stranded-DNA-specific exonuclease RecJ [Bacteroidota bacterium]
MQKRWVAKPLPTQEIVTTLYEEMEAKVNKTLVTMMAQRGVSTLDEAKNFFNPDMSFLHDPFLMKGMAEATDRIKQAFKKGEKILVYGDYDVDGTTSVAVVYSCLKSLYENVLFYIPDRFKEGYGVSKQAVEWASEQGVKLVITLDCGIKSADLVSLADTMGIDFIIADHHTPDDDIPQAVAVLNPKQLDCDYPYKELSGCGIGYKLVQALAQDFRIEPEDYLDLVVVSIAADIVPLDGENRILAHFGLKKLNSNPRPSLKALMELSGIRAGGVVSIDDLVFKIGPRINAAGRIATGELAVQMLIEKDYDAALKIVAEININNVARQGFDQNITAEAMALIDDNEALRNRKTTVLFNESWHKGVIGIVASRLIEKYYRPTVLLTASNGFATGSARSVRGYDLYSAIAECAHLLDKWGGHQAAAGLTLKRENIEAFSDAFEAIVSRTITEEQLTPIIEYDLEIPFSQITATFCKTIERFGPFGPQNMKPMFVTKELHAFGKPNIVGNNHLQFKITHPDAKTSHKAIAFGMGAMLDEIHNAKSFDLIYHIDPNEFKGSYYIAINVKDIKITA